MSEVRADLVPGPATITTTQNGELIYTSYGNGNGSAKLSYTVSGGFTQLDTILFVPPPIGAAGGYMIQTTAGAIAPTWTPNVSDQIAVSVAAFKHP